METNQTVALLNNYAVFCKDNHHFLAGSIALKRAIQLDPNHATLWSNYGTCLYNLNDYKGAEEALKTAMTLAPKETNSRLKASPFSNFALLKSAQEDWTLSENTFKRAIEIDDDFLNPKWDLACMYLDKGDWKKGFDLYDVRIPFKGQAAFPKFPYPIWEGEDLNGKTIFVNAEQGMGDRILFSRYLSWLKGKYPTCKIIYICEPSAHSLFWEFRHIVDFYPIGVPWPEADYGIYQMSLPKFHESRPNKVPKDPGLLYKRIFPNSNLINLPQPNMKSLKVGICWAGNPEQDLNRFRSIPLELMLGLAENPRITLYSLQVGPNSKDIKELGAGELICDLSEDLAKKGYVGTGQVMLNLDLVITCCTSVAHLAGALGVPCWTLLCNAPYWVWLSKGEKTVWYPKTKLFRQTVPGEWSEVINKVKDKLFELAEKI